MGLPTTIVISCGIDPVENAAWHLLEITDWVAQFGARNVRELPLDQSC